MKQRTYVLTENTRGHVAAALAEQPADGTVEVVFRSVQGKSARQRGLQHLWYDDVLKSGVGGKYESNKELLDLSSKYRWALPILVRDDPLFAEMYLAYHEQHGDDPDRMMWFVREHVHTERLDQGKMAEFLTNFQNYYGYDLGVELTDPNERGWAGLLEIAQ